MNPERLRQIEELYHAAREIEADQRQAFLMKACGADAEMRQEVASLLDQDSSGGPLGQPVLSVAAGLLGQDRFEPGSRVGPYHIVSRLGEGGMGEVYRARDTRLGRTIAIKVAHQEFSGRSQREARAISALNHPNICTLHDIGPNYLVMELVEGETLARLLENGALPEELVLRYGSQIADALSAAHAKGITHRDLKPGNIMVTKAGIKVLDFGLARFAPGRDPAATQADTATSSQTFAGTPAYAAPEQLEGKECDARTDIFALGQVLYEMATGKRPFQGDSQAGLIADIMRCRPHLGNLSPPQFARVVQRCLAKEPENRWQAARDVKLELDALLCDGERRSRGIRRFWPAAAALGVLAAAGAVLYPRNSGPDPSVSVLTSLAGTEEMVSFSPSGNEIAFSWKPEGQDNFDVYVKQIGPGRTIQLTKDPADDMAPRWSPDGKLIAFLRRRPDSVLDVFVLPAWGGLLERKVGEANGAGGLTPVSASLYCLDWSPDGRWLVVTKRDPGNNRGIALVPVEPGQPRWLTSPRMPEVDGNGTIAPDGHALAFYRSQGPGLLIQPLSASLEPRGPAKAIPLHTEQPVLTLSWTADSRDIIFSAGMSDNATLWRVPAFGGTPKRLSFAGDAAIAPAISRRGKRLAFERYLGEFNIWSLDLDEKGQAIGEAVKAFNSSKSEICPRFSPDGTKVAFESGRSGNDEIWVCLADDSKCQQLTFFNGPHAGSPAWSPNGEWIVFDSFRMGTTQMYLVNSGGGEPKPLADDVMAPAFSHDGEWIVFRCSRADEQLAGLCRIPVVGGRWERLTEDLGFLSMPSKDGQWIYYSGNPIVSGGPASRRYLRKIPASGGAWTEVLSPVAGRNFAVVKDGVWYLTPSTKEGSLLQFYDFATKKARTVYRTKRPVYAGFTVSPNERRILFTQVDRNPDLDLVLVDNFR